MQIFCSKHLSISSINNCVSCGKDDIESVACGKCAVSVEGDTIVNRIVCLKEQSYGIDQSVENVVIPIIDAYNGFSADGFVTVSRNQGYKLLA